MKNSAGSFFLLIFLSVIFPVAVVSSDCSGSWAEVEDILATVNPPVFPDRDFNVLDYRAKDGGAKIAAQRLWMRSPRVTQPGEVGW